MTRPRFDPTISLGHVLTVVGFILPFFAWVVATNYAQDARISVLESGMRTLTTASTEAATDLRTGMRRLDDKISALLIQGYRPEQSRR